MDQLTVRGFDDDLTRAIRRLATEEGISLSKAAIRLMRRGAQLDNNATDSRIGDALDEFIGVWDESQQREFDAAIEACFEQIDPAMWE